MKFPEFEDCLKRGKIVRFPVAKKLAGKEFDVARALVEQAEEFLKVAEDVVSG